MKRTKMQSRILLALAHTAIFFFLIVPASAQSDQADESLKLREEVQNRGWLAYSSRSENGTWDIFLSRPDGSQRQNITNSADYEEAAPRFSPAGDKLMYRRLPKGTTINHDQWGFQGELATCNPDGSDPQILGGEGDYPWAVWSADAKKIACLTKKGIQIIDLQSREIEKQIPRNGIYQQLAWSPDEKWFCGTANYKNEYWTVVRMNIETSEINALRSYQNCTPDWYPDSNHVILSSRPAGQAGAKGYGYTQLWEVDGEGKQHKLLYGEDGLHIYGGAVSPDGAYVIFTRCPEDGGGAEKSGGTLCIIRMKDTPMVGGESPDLRQLHPDAKSGPMIEIDKGWEPHWTSAEIKAAP
ncbi:MAG: Protein TolB [Candidatus Hinthialibacteria bacterium OLB16]|nr:MAG: Protein TolB [Candidatus Hinthialibacteria bacterium OLB16]